MTGFTDRMDLGYFPLQDHAASDQGVPVAVRQSIAGGRITKLTDPTRCGGNAAESMLEYGREFGLGTLGDVHPWLFWQTRERAARGSGAWAQLFGAMVVGADARYGTNSVQPIRDGSWHNDTRFREKRLSWPVGLSRPPKGALLLALPGTEEDAQHDLGFWADPRLIAPNASGPGEVGTLVVDLGPSNVLCMGNSETPGMGGRHARLQSLVRVIAVPPNQGLGGIGGPGNVLALNHTMSGTDAIAGYGAIFAPVVGRRGPVTPRGNTSGPVTPRSDSGETSMIIRAQGDPDSGYAAGSGRGIIGEPNVGEGAFGADLGGDPPTVPGTEEFTPRSFGAFLPVHEDNHGVAFMQAVRTYGPIHAGADGDKHEHGRDRDGHAVNAAHLSTGAYWFRNSDEDGPMLFEGDYPHPGPLPLTSKTHLAWDGGTQHAFAGGVRLGVWRWWSEVPYVTPSTPSGPTTPRGGGGPATPGGPGGPGPGRGPTTPGGGRGPLPGGRGPTTPGGGRTPGGSGTPRGKGTGTPRRGGLPPRPVAPITPRGGLTGPGGNGTGPVTPREPDGPPPTVTPRGLPGPWDGPKGAGGKGAQGAGGDPSSPQGPGAGPTTPGGASTPNGGLCSATTQSTTTDPNSTTESRNYATTPSQRATLGESAIAPRDAYGAGAFIGGPGGNGTRFLDARLPLGRLAGQNPWTREPERLPGVVERVGGADRDSVALYAIHHPMHESFAAMSFRPQLWAKGYPHFEHNPQVPAEMILRDEAVRPQVLTMRAWGGQSSSGDWAYVQSADTSRARGGTANGGVLFAPPRFEMEDYLGIGSVADVDVTTGTRATTSYVLAAPGVAFALGKPTITGGLAANSVTIAQDVTVATRPLTVKHNAVEVLRAYSSGTERIVQAPGTTALQIPVGTTAQQPATPANGMVRLNTSGGIELLEHYAAALGGWMTVASTGSAGVNSSFSFFDNDGFKHIITLENGVVTQWDVV